MFRVNAYSDLEAANIFLRVMVKKELALDSKIESEYLVVVPQNQDQVI